MIEKRRSKIQGWGVYATQAISKNTRVIDYAGEKISNQVSLKREARYIETLPKVGYRMLRSVTIEPLLGCGIVALARLNGWQLPKLTIAITRPVPAAPIGL